MLSGMQEEDNMKYSASTNAFYDPTINTNIPSDAVEITTDQWYTYISIPAGKQITPDSNGQPTITDKPGLGLVDRTTNAKNARDTLLTNTDWLTLRHADQLARNVTTTLSSTQYTDLLAYRQALRDLPTNSQWPDITFPTPPSFIG